MIMDKNHGRSRFANDRVKNFARMHKRCRKRAFGNFDLADLAVLVVEENDVEKLAHFSAEIFTKMTVDVLRRAQRLAGLPFLSADAPGDFQTSLDLRDLGRTDAFN